MIIRNSQRGKCNLPKFENPKEPEPAKAIDPNLVATDQKRFHQILCDKLRQYIKKQVKFYLLFIFLNLFLGKQLSKHG
jgi:hypothetical protein